MRARVGYLSYDGALDPLGATQVVPYLEGLARSGVQFDLITFEKPARLEDVERVSMMSSRLAGAGINWHPLRYHKSPRVPATLFDVVHGALLLRRLSRNSKFDFFHCRGDVPPVMVRIARLPGPLLLDMRGFFSEERVDAGSWARGSLLDRSVRAMERQNLARASRVVVLTERGRNVLRTRGVTLPVDVIPTCVDPRAFTPVIPRLETRFDLVYFGSLGGWYMTEEMIEFVAEVRRRGDAIRVLFLTNNVDNSIRTRLQQAGITLGTASPEEVPRWLSQCRATFFFIRATPSKVASCPTKLAEALAMGLPVLTGPGVGDVDDILKSENVGVVLEDFSGASYWHGWKALSVLLHDPQARDRCRTIAEKQLSVERAVMLYASAYKDLCAAGS